MSNFKGFWSYVHADDQAESERITRLARDVKEQFQMLTGEEISLFLDKDSLEWGENWREAIDSNLSSVAFFIPVMTPRYFMSPECRRELQTFARRATNLGIRELVLPLLYVDVPEVHNENTTDELIQLVRTFQWEDWRERRFLDVMSEGYRRGVSQLANRLVEANRQAETSAHAIVSSTEVTESEANLEDTPGIIDRLANAEKKLQNMPDTTRAITKDVNLIGQYMRESTADIERANSQGKGFSARLIITRKLATRLEEPVENIWLLSNEFASQIHDVDDGVRIIIERAPMEITDNPAAKENFCDFFTSILGWADATKQALEGVQSMLTAMEPIEKMSRDIRPVVRHLRKGLTIQKVAMEVGLEWVELIESSGIECEDM